MHPGNTALFCPQSRLTCRLGSSYSCGLGEQWSLPGCSSPAACPACHILLFKTRICWVLQRSCGHWDAVGKHKWEAGHDAPALARGLSPLRGQHRAGPRSGRCACIRQQRYDTSAFLPLRLSALAAMEPSCGPLYTVHAALNAASHSSRRCQDFSEFHPNNQLYQQYSDIVERVLALASAIGRTLYKIESSVSSATIGRGCGK